MLFYGRLLATNLIGEIWQEGDMVWIHLRDRQVTLAMSREDMHVLLDLLRSAEAAETKPELRRDEIRRLQIARSRIAERIERAKGRPRDAGPEEA